jgi:hypothetical protein
MASTINIFAIDQLSPIWPAVEAQISKDRAQYEHLYQALEKYLSEEPELLVGGTTGVNLLLGKTKNMDDYTYELYSEDPFRHANVLTNLMAEQVEKHYKKHIPKVIVMLKSSIPYRKYIIFVDNRALITIFDLGRAKEVSTIAVINPVTVETFDKSHQIKVLTAEMQLINLYRTLYSPNNAGEWEVALKDENQLFHKLEAEIALAPPINGADGASDSQVKITTELRNKIQNTILQEFVQNNPHSLLLGEHALFLMINESVKHQVVQIISDREPEEDFRELTRVLKSITSAPITKHTRMLHILQDWRLVRTIIKIGDQQSGESKEIMYIYNSARHDLIPFIKFYTDDNKKTNKGASNFIQVGNPFVILRFLVIDFWIIRWLTFAGGINEGYSKHRQNSLKEKIVNLRSKLSKQETIRSPHVAAEVEIFQPQSDSYLGSYEDENIAQKEKAQELSKKYNDYYPQEYFVKNGEYRSLTL